MNKIFKQSYQYIIKNGIKEAKTSTDINKEFKIDREPFKKVPISFKNKFNKIHKINVFNYEKKILKLWCKQNKLNQEDYTTMRNSSWGLLASEFFHAQCIIKGATKIPLEGGAYNSFPQYKSITFLEREVYYIAPGLADQVMKVLCKALKILREYPLK